MSRVRENNISNCNHFLKVLHLHIMANQPTPPKVPSRNKALLTIGFPFRPY